MRASALYLSIGLPFLLAACAVSTPPVDVTRFHNGDQAPITPGSVIVKDAGEEGPLSLEQGTYNAAVLREMQKISFVGPDLKGDNSQNMAKADYIVEVMVDQSRINPNEKPRSPVSVGVGGSTGSYGSGIGVGIGINLSGPPKATIATQLAVRIKRSADGAIVWEGRSSVEAKEGAPAAQPGLAAAKLAEALFQGFPGESGRTIKVK